MAAPNPDEQNASDARVDEARSRLADAAARVSTSHQWREVLTLGVHNQHMSAANLLLLWHSNPTAGPVDSAAGWRARGRDIPSGARGTTVLTAMPSGDAESRQWRTTVVYSHPHTVAVDEQRAGTSARSATTPPSSPDALLRQLREHAQHTGWSLQFRESPSHDSNTITLPAEAGRGQQCHVLASHLARAAAGADLADDWIARAATDLVTRRAGLTPTTPLPEPPAAPEGTGHAEHVRELATRIVRTARTLAPPPSRVSADLAARVHTARAAATETRERAELGAGASTGPAPSPSTTAQHGRLAAANEAAADYFADRLQRSSAARGYLTERVGADAHQLPAGWRVGYAPSGWTALRDNLREQGFDDDTLLAAGLAQRTQRGGVIDRFHHRLMIGVHDQHDRLTGFTGRTLHPDSGTSPKYLNTPATQLYDKSSALLGLTEQRSALAVGTRSPLLVEGPLDALALAVRDPADGAWAPISTCGTAATPAHLNHLRDASSTTLTFGLDGDDAGRAATERLARLTYTDPDRATRVLELPDGHDPASYLAAGGNPAPSETTDAAEWLLGRLVSEHRGLDHPEWSDKQVATLEHGAELLAPLSIETAAPLTARLGAELTQIPLDTVTNRVVQAHVDRQAAPRRAATNSTTTTAAAAADSAARAATTPSARPQAAHQPNATPPRARPTTPT